MTADSATATAARIAATGATIRRSMQRHRQRGDRETDQHQERRAVGRARKRDEQDERETSRCAVSVSAASPRRWSASTARPAKMSVSRMPAIHGSVVVTDSADDDGEQGPRPLAEPVGAQHERQHPDGGGRLQRDHRPEIERPAGDDEQPVDGRAARHQVALEPARQIAAGVVLQEAGSRSRWPARAASAWRRAPRRRGWQTSW